MVKHRINKFDDIDKQIPKSYLDKEVCDNYDPLPPKTPREVLLELRAGAEIRDNNLRKLYFGDQNDDSDVFDARDRYEEFMAQKIHRFQNSNSDSEASESAPQSETKSAEDLTKSKNNHNKE